MELEFLSIVFILLGIALLVAEIFIPSFGVTGVLGIIAIIGGIVFTASSVNQGIIMFLVILVIVLILMFVAYKFVASRRSPLIQKAILNEENTNQDLTFFIDKVGVALTILRPAGKGDFDGVRLDVMTEGNFIRKDQAIVVTRIEGKKIFVNEVSKEVDKNE